MPGRNDPAGRGAAPHHDARTRGGLATEIALLDEVGAAMKDASICGLGQTAYAAIESAIKRLRLYERLERTHERADHPDPDRPPARRAAPGVSLTIDGRAGERARGHDDPRRPARRIGVTIPTLCYLETLSPSTCAGSASWRSKARGCSCRAARAPSKPAWSCTRDRRGSMHARKLVLELLASSVDLSTTPGHGGVAEGIRLSSRSASVLGPGRGPREPARPPSTRQTQSSRRRSRSRSRSTTISTSAITANACSATNASRRAGRITRTRSPLRWPAVDSTRTSPPSSRWRCRTRRACTAATASPSVRRAR